MRRVVASQQGERSAATRRFGSRPRGHSPTVGRMAPVRSRRVLETLAKLDLEEKASLLSGLDLWTTKPLPDAGVPSIWMADGPHGVRKAPRGDQVGIGTSLPATCFPTLSALGASFDVDLARRVGRAIGLEARALGVDVVLGPGVNLHRSPLGGRNFEYFSEDPELAGELGAAFVAGLQGEGVGASVKHFAANDQETGRMFVDAVVDERTLRELHLRPFEIVTTRAKPWTVMCAYNRVNGAFASEDAFLLDHVLVRDWGYEGVVVSDWGAVNDRVEGVRAGLHLEMPSSGGVTDREVIDAVRSGALPEAIVDERAAAILELVFRAEEARSAAGVEAPRSRLPDSLRDVNHALGREAAAACSVLVRNEGGLLPLDAGRRRRIALIGRFAKEPRYGGGGSSQMVPARLESALDALRSDPGAHEIDYAEGVDERHESDPALLDEARRVARDADVAVVFVGLPASMEVEGADRRHLDLPASHVALVDAVASVQPDLVVVVVAGAPVRLPFADRASAILVAGLGGQAGGAGVADVLLGRADPGGRLATSWPRRIEDTPCFHQFPGEPREVRYGEGVFVGYRHYDTARIDPLYAFGHGLSYARFEWDDLEVDPTTLQDGERLGISLRVRNVGTCAGSDVIQVYVHDEQSLVPRPEQELRAFAKVSLAAGDETRVRFSLDRRAFAFFDPRVHAFVCEPGGFEIRIARSSRDVVLRSRVVLEVAEMLRPPFDRHTPIRSFLEDERARAALLPIVAKVVKALFGDAGLEAATGNAAGAADSGSFFLELPVGKLVSLSRGAVTREALAALLAAANARVTHPERVRVGQST